MPLVATSWLRATGLWFSYHKFDSYCIGVHKNGTAVFNRKIKLFIKMRSKILNLNASGRNSKIEEKKSFNFNNSILGWRLF